MAFEKPFRIEINPLGKIDESDQDNIFIVDNTGLGVLIISKHPVWTYLKKERMPIAEFVLNALNKDYE
jgi:hypothetical protein